MRKIHGVPVILMTTVQEGTDPFGQPIEREVEVIVDNVIISPASSDDIISQQNLHGKKAVYTLGIPKGDTHDWENKQVKFFGRTFKTFGIPTEGIESMIPLEWNKKVMVEANE